MTLATVDANGMPSARTVLLKNMDERGFVFFTNFNSRKGKQMAENPGVALVFLWKEQERQVRIEGIAEKIDEQESDKYFFSRPIASQIGSCISPQSSTIPNRDYLHKLWDAFEERFKENEIKRPEYWGGYRIIPSLFEFWQGRPSRLHDRIQYRKSDDKWVIERLAP